MESMDWNSDQSKIYTLIENSERIAVVAYITELRSPYGTEDFKLVKSLWEKMNFKVIAIRNPSFHDLKIRLRNIVTDIDNNAGRHDVFCFTYIGHGGLATVQHGGITYTCEYIKFTDISIHVDEIRHLFLTSSCKGLAGCPKVFVFQCCRGFGEETPAEISASASVVPQHIDFYTIQSCVTGYRSEYNLVNGQSYFIKTLCEMFEENFQSMDIHSMGTAVVSKLSSIKCQTAEQTSTLTKHLYFSGVRGTTLPRFIRTLPYVPQLPQQNAPSSSALHTEETPSDLSECIRTAEGAIRHIKTTEDYAEAKSCFELLLTSIQEEGQRGFPEQEGLIKAVLTFLNTRLHLDKNCNLLLLGWKILARSLKSSESNVKRFVKSQGIDLQQDHLQSLPNHQNVKFYILHTAFSVSSYQHSAVNLMKKDILKLLLDILTSSSDIFKVRYCAALVISNLAWRGPGFWTVTHPSRTQACDALSAAVDSWSLDDELPWTCSSFKGVLRCLEDFNDPPGCHHFVAWEIAHATKHDASVHFPILEAEGGLCILQKVIASTNHSSKVKELAKIANAECLRRKSSENEMISL